MPSMLHSGWLLLLLGGLAIIIVGCIALFYASRNPATFVSVHSSPTSLISHPNWDYHPQFEPLTIITPKQDNRLVRVKTKQPPLLVDPPICYTRANGGYTCLGMVHNESDQQYRNLAVQTHAYNRANQVLYSANVPLEQHLLLPHSQAPYRVLLPSLDDEIDHSQAIIVRPQIDPIHSPIELEVMDPDIKQSASGQYVVDATLHNPHPADVQNMRVVATLLDDAQRVIGYRVHDLSATLASGTSQDIAIKIYPIVQHEDTITVIIHAEAHPLNLDTD